MPDQGDVFAGLRPSFSPIGPNAGRVGVIDIGSNSVRLVVFDEACRAPNYFFNEKASCGLGVGIARTGLLNPEGRAMALQTLRRFVALAERMRVHALEAVATAAVREAEDGPQFRDQVLQEIGLKMRVITGDEEARLAALGVLLGEPVAVGGVCDMGGASMELAEIGGAAVGRRITLALGPQRLEGLSGKALVRQIDAELARAAHLNLSGRPLWLVGGAWRAFAKLQMVRAGHPLPVLHGHRIDPADAADTAAWIAAQSPETLRETADISANRAVSAPLAATVLGRVLAALEPSVVEISSFGLREGVFFGRLPLELRARDPLLEAARRLEGAQARFPGFGEELFAWLAPALAAFDKRERRLAHAACLLADVNWRVHPDFRPASCFETATRANIAGLDHADRVYIGFALMERYGGGHETVEIARALTLLDGARQARARAVGRGMRLGAMISASTRGALEETTLEVEAGALRLGIGAGAQALESAIVERRLSVFAQSLGLAGRLEGAT